MTEGQRLGKKGARAPQLLETCQEKFAPERRHAIAAPGLEDGAGHRDGEQVACSLLAADLRMGKSVKHTPRSLFGLYWWVFFDPGARTPRSCELRKPARTESSCAPEPSHLPALEWRSERVAAL